MARDFQEIYFHACHFLFFREFVEAGQRPSKAWELGSIAGVNFGEKCIAGVNISKKNVSPVSLSAINV